MWLMHKPTGKKAIIAKDFGNGWRVWPSSPMAGVVSLQELFDDSLMPTTDYTIVYEQDN